MLQIFRLIGTLEGITYLLILGFTMPLKYWAGIETPNKFAGIVHGSFFILFVVLSAIYCWEEKWGIKRFVIFFVASILPFGTFYADQKYLRKVS